MTTPFDSAALLGTERTTGPDLAMREMPAPDAISATVARDLLETAAPSVAASNRAFFWGDHWQNGLGWIGPALSVNDAAGTLTSTLIQKAFTSKNAIKEVTERHTAGVVGRESDWGFAPRRALRTDEAPSPAEQTLIGEAEAALTAWTDAVHLRERLAEAVRGMLLERAGTLRLFVPAGFLVTESTTDPDTEETSVTQTVRASDLPDALRQLALDAPRAGQGMVLHDPVTQQDVALYVEQKTDGTITAELSYLAAETDANGDPLTVIRVMDSTGQTRETQLPLGGRLPMYTALRDLLISEQVQQQQRALNLAISMLPRNVVADGFVERVLLNAQLPGKMVDDATVAGGKRFQPDPLYIGAGTTNVFSGITTQDPATGAKTVQSPSVVWHDPGDNAPLISAAAEHYRHILDEVKQAHVLMNADATASGASRLEARQDYIASLSETADKVHAMGCWLLETALAMAELFSGQPGRYTEALRAVFTPRLDPGPVDAATQQQIATQVQQGLVSLETAMTLLGIEDPAAEIARIQAQPGANLELRQRQATVYAAWIAAGLPSDAAAKLAGMSDEDIAILTQAQQDVVPASAPAPALVA